MASGPITWKTVNDNTDYRGIAALSQSGVDNIQGAFDTFGGIVKDRNKRVVDSNTDAFTDKLNSMSMEQLAAGREDGSIDKLRASYGSMIDQDGTRNLGREMLTGLRTEANATTAYDQNIAKEAAAPLYQNFMGMTNANDFAGAAKDLEANKDVYIASGDFGQMTAALKSAEVAETDAKYKTMLRARGEEDRANEEGYSAMLASPEYKDMTQSEARNYANSAEARQQWGYDAGESYTRGQEGDAAWLARNSLTAAQGQQLEDFTLEKTNAANKVQDAAQASFDEGKRINQPAQGEYNWLDSEAVTRQSLANTATEIKDFDNGEWLGNAPMVTIAQGQKEWKEKYLKDLNLTDEQMNSELTDNVINQITQQAILSLNDDRFGWGTDNLEEDDIADAMKIVAKDWVAQLKRNKLVDDAQTRLTTDIATADGMRKNLRDTTRQFMKNKDRSLLNPAAKIPSPTPTNTGTGQRPPYTIPGS